MNNANETYNLNQYYISHRKHSAINNNEECQLNLLSEPIERKIIIHTGNILWETNTWTSYC